MAWTGARAGLLCRSRYTRENELTGSSECGPGNDMTHVWLSGPKDRRSPRLRPTREQDVDLSAASAVVDVSGADGRQQCPSNGWQRTLEYGPLNPAGSGRQPSGIKHENRQSVARGNLRNRAKLRSRQCIGLERDMICTAPWKAKKSCKAYLRGILPYSETSGAYSSAVSGKSPYA